MRAEAVVVRIGNNGEGILLNGQIYLRDFYEAGIHLNPWISNDVSEQIKFQWISAKLENIFPEDALLIKSKLTDLDREIPGLGLLSTLILEDLNIRFSDKKSLFDEKRDGSFFVVALRIKDSLYIHKRAWAQMDAANRVGLLVHEVIYSLGNRNCTHGITCKQFSEEIRPLVAELFRVKHPPSFVDELFEKLAIQPLYGLCSKPIATLNYRIFKKTAKTCNSGKCPVVSKGGFTVFRNNEAASAKNISDICGQFKKSKSLDNASLQIEVAMNNVNIVKRFYGLEKGDKNDEQAAYLLSDSSQNYFLDISSEEAPICENKIRRELARLSSSFGNDFLFTRESCEP